MTKLFEQMLVEASIEAAHRFAKRKHDDTKIIRKHSGDPYIVHPEGVAALAKAYGGTDDEIKAAFLHDTVEDTGTTIEDIEEKFGQDVANIVDAVTNNLESLELLGKEQYMNDKLCTLQHPALFVKLCDFLYNSLDYPSISQAKRMLNNIIYLIRNRDDLDDRENELIDSTLEALVVRS